MLKSKQTENYRKEILSVLTAAPYSYQLLLRASLIYCMKTISDPVFFKLIRNSPVRFPEPRSVCMKET